jgi:photosystem II stability/assembly factor-like uncharacterized protein
MKKYLLLVLIAISCTISAQTWQVLNTGVPASLKVSALCFTGDSQYDIGYAVGGQYYQTGYVIKTTDGGDTWSAQTVLTNDYATGVSFPTSLVGFVCAQNGKIFKTTDGGTNWLLVYDNANVMFYRIAFKDVNTGIAGGGGGVYYTSDGGLNWTASPTGNNFNLQDVCWAGGNTWYEAGYSAAAMSNDNGATWTVIQTQNGDLKLGVDALTTSTVGVVGDYGRIIISTNSGSTWLTNSVDDMLFHDIVFWTDSIIYATATPGMIYKSTNAGQTWTNTDYLGDHGMFCFFKTPGKLYVCGSQGKIWRMEDSVVVTAPAIGLGAGNIVFDSTLVTLTSHENLTINNTGTANLVVSGIVSTNPVFSVTPSTFTVVPGGSQVVDVAFTPTQAGNVSATLNISHNAASTNPLPVAVEGKGYITTGLVALPNLIAFTIYPNPSDGKVFIEANERGVMRITDPKGSLIRDMQVETGTQTPMLMLPKGTYFVKFFGTSGTSVQKLVVR